MTPTKPTLEDVLDELACEAALTGETVRRYLDAYPHFASDITDFSLECQIADDTSEPPTVSAQAAGDRFLDGLVASFSQGIPARNPLADKDIRVVEAGTGIAGPLLDAMRKGLIRSSTIPDVVIRKLVAFAGVTRDGILSGLTMPTGMAGALEYKSARKPSPSEPRPFDYYFDQSGLSDEEKQRTLAE